MTKYLFVFIFFSTFFILSSAPAKHLYKEKDYQQDWCGERKGITEYVLDDGARVDCLLPDYAVEFDFAEKWAESIGQSLYYAEKTGRKPAVVLILENKKDKKYLERLIEVAEDHGITVWTIAAKSHP